MSIPIVPGNYPDPGLPNGEEILPRLVHEVAPGWRNTVRAAIRRRVRFSTYVRFIAPVIGWPATRLRGLADGAPSRFHRIVQLQLWRDYLLGLTDHGKVYRLIEDEQGNWLTASLLFPGIPPDPR